LRSEELHPPFLQHKTFNCHIDRRRLREREIKIRKVANIAVLVYGRGRGGWNQF
jgi:hypothetical protein